MRKNASFAVAALAFTLAMILFATSTVVGNSADIRPKAGVPYVASIAAFLPVKALEPAW
jgi:hypothetical protein